MPKSSLQERQADYLGPSSLLEERPCPGPSLLKRKGPYAAKREVICWSVLCRGEGVVF